MTFLKFSNSENKSFLLNPQYITEIVAKGADICTIINFKGQEWTVNHSLEEIEEMIETAINHKE